MSTTYVSPTHHEIVRLLDKHLPQPRKASIIDYGCGDGILIQALGAKRIAKYQGFDVNAASLSSAKKTYSSSKFSFKPLTEGTVPSLGSKKSVDAIILVGVWQYLDDHERRELLKKSQQVLKKDGLLIMSVLTDHWWQRMFDLLQFFSQYRLTKRSVLLQQLDQANFKVLHQQERGLVWYPLFSHALVLGFDALDKIIFRTHGSLGPVGSLARRLATPLIEWEFTLPIDRGLTLFVVAGPQL